MNESTSKVLTVIVPTYNMERYLTQCLESITSISNVADIDLVVVNDGSTDRSSEIAHTFESRFPGSVSVIDKVNGHYGSCVNAGLAVACGKYVKVVDADDWVDSANFQKSVGELKSCDDDLVICQYMDYYDDDNGKCVLRDKVKIKKARLSLSEIVKLKSCRPPLFHASILYKTSLLKAIGYKQVEGRLYTDMQWASVPMANVTGAAYFGYPVYVYRKGRSGQSLSTEVRSANHGDELFVRKEIAREFAKGNFVSDGNKALCEKLICRLVAQMYRDALVKKEIAIDMIKEFDDDLRSINSFVYKRMNRELAYDALCVPYVWLWRHGWNGVLDAALAVRSLFRGKKN